jgi:hypothetical protein
MIDDSTMLEDDFPDEVLEILKSLNSHSAWSKEKRQLADKLINLLTSKGYVYFHVTNPHRYRVSTVGASYLYDVPLYKQGHLAPFRGQRVRVVCTHSGKNATRGIMVNGVSISPPDKVIKKLPRPASNYIFPDYIAHHEVLYKSPRFVVFRVNQKLKILSEDASAGYIDTNGWNAILVDGKAGSSIGTLQLNDNGSVKGRLLKWKWPGNYNYESLRCAIDDLAEKYWYLPF